MMRMQNRKYRENVAKLRNQAFINGLSDQEIDEIIEECLEILYNEETPSEKSKKAFVATVLTFFALLLFGSYVAVNVHQPTASFVLQNVQNLIYPVLKVLRFFSVPVITKFPHLTELYDESCLLENPYFFVNDMECWPCENVYSVLDLTGFNNMSLYPYGVPYVAKTNQKPVSYSGLRKILLENSETFSKDANKLTSTDNRIKTVKNMETFVPNTTADSKTHITWRINRMRPARIIRRLFPRPHFISEWSGQSIERFVQIDEPNAEKYDLPNFECGYVLMLQGYGERTIILKPSGECKDVCKSVSVVLKPSYALWYNWWYWRPISLPGEKTNEVSISYITSFC